MTTQTSLARRPLLGVGGALLLTVTGFWAQQAAILLAQAATGQTQTEQSHTGPQWVKAAGGHAEFDAASVREDPTGKWKGTPFSTDADEDFSNASGLFTADGLISGYIAFAYKLPQQYSMISRLPDWAKSKHFEIMARAPAGTTKDQMRLMMQSLLAERFKLAMHFEAQETPVLVMTLMKPGKLGPRLRLHKDGPACDVVTPRPPGATITFDMFPCNTYMAATDRPDVMLAGARNTTMELMAAFFSNVGYKKPIVDRTGISGTIDFSMEYAPPVRGGTPPTGDGQALVPGATFEDAVRDQLGLKMEPGRAPLQIPVVDHVELASEN